MHATHPSPAPLVKIIIPAFGRAELFRACLRSAVKQSYQNIKIEVIDNTRSDELYRVVGEFDGAPIIYKKNSKNIGARANIQKAFRNFGGDYFLVVTSDILLDVDFVARAVAVAEADGRVDIVFSASTNFPLARNGWVLSGPKIERGKLEGASKGRLFWSEVGLLDSGRNCLIPASLAVQAFFNYGVPPSCTAFEVLIRAEFFAGINQKLFFDFGSNAEEYRHAIGLLMYADHIFFLSEELKFGPEHSGREKKPIEWFRAWEKIYVVQSLFEENSRALVFLGVVPSKVARFLITSYELFLIKFPDCPIGPFVKKELLEIKRAWSGLDGIDQKP